MYPFPSYYGIRSCPTRSGDGFLHVQGGSSMDEAGISTVASNSTAEAKSLAASKSHSEAERRRRERINSHLATLRTLLPTTTKTDKASLLAEVVQHVKELKKKLAETAVTQDGDRSSREWTLPGETDELTLGYCDAESTLIRVSVCCDDRPELVSDMAQALRSVRAKVVKAEMATVGGRTKSVVVLQRRNGGGGEADFVALRKALKGVVDKSDLSAPGQVLPGIKRPRLSRQLMSNDF